MFVLKIDGFYMERVFSTLCWRAVALPEFVDKVQWVMAMPKLIGKISVVSYSRAAWSKRL